MKATIFNKTWTAKVPGAKGGDCLIVATDDKGNSANISHVTYGDVWYCGGKSVNRLQAICARLIVGQCQSDGQNEFQRLYCV